MHADAREDRCSVGVTGRRTHAVLTRAHVGLTRVRGVVEVVLGVTAHTQGVPVGVAGGADLCSAVRARALILHAQIDVIGVVVVAFVAIAALFVSYAHTKLISECVQEHVSVLAKAHVRA